MVVKRKSEKPIEGVTRGRIELGCEKSGKYKRNPKCKPKDDPQSRETGTKKSQCPFALKGVHVGDGKWKVTVKCGMHNHSLGATLVGHSYAGRLKPKEFEVVKNMTAGGSAPRNILATLKENFKDNLSTKKQIYNARAKLNMAEMQRMTIMQFLLKKLQENDYLLYTRVDEDTNVITDLFWCKKESIDLFVCFPQVLLVDCTYKTNKYKLPLFEMIGVTSIDKSFNVAYAFLSHEREENYVWALERLYSLLLPNRLPRVFVTDCEMALINGIKRIFPQSGKFYI